MAKKLEALCEEMLKAEAAVDRASSRNVVGMTSKERVASDVQYRKALKAFVHARIAYEKALDEATDI